MLDFEREQLICPSSISLTFYLLHFVEANELLLVAL